MLTCAVLIAAQTVTITDLQKKGPPMAQDFAPSELEPARLPALSSANPRKQELDRLRKENAELQNLRAEAAQLRSQAERLTQLRVDNRKLVSELAAMDAAIGGGAMANARQNAQSIQCINNLKQIGLAARMFANDNQATLPPDLISMKQYLVTPKVLHCPADTSKTGATDWGEFGPGQSSYDVVTLGFKETEVEPNVVLVRCSVHGHVCLADGSVHTSPERNGAGFATKNGKQVLVQPAAPIQTPAVQARPTQ